MIRRDLIAMGAVAAVVGIALAALLTLAFGARSSGPPAGLKRAATPADEALEPRAPRKAVRRKVEREQPRPRTRPVQVAAPAPAPKPAAQTAPRTITQTNTETVSRPQQVAEPQPAPEPVQPLSRPKPSKPTGGSPGVSFDDSG